MVVNWIKRTIKIAISLVYFVLVALIRSGSRLIGRSSDGRLVVLYYHGVPAKFQLNFKRQMDSLQRGAVVVPASHRGRLPAGKRYVAITFDDALESIIKNALPELASRSFHATVFVPVGWIGRRPCWAVDGDALDPDDAVMSGEQLEQLNPSLVSLGAHTVTHRRLSQLDAESIWEEIEGSHSRLAELVGRDIRSFSFPYGDYNASCVAACEAAGYERVFSILPEEIDAAGAEILVGRTNVDPSDGPIEFFLKFNGGYAWAAQITPLTRKLRAIVAKFGGLWGGRQERRWGTLIW